MPMGADAIGVGGCSRAFPLTWPLSPDSSDAATHARVSAAYACPPRASRVRHMRGTGIGTIATEASILKTSHACAARRAARSPSGAGGTLRHREVIADADPAFVHRRADAIAPGIGRASASVGIAAGARVAGGVRVAAMAANHRERQNSDQGNGPNDLSNAARDHWAPVKPSSCGQPPQAATRPGAICP